MDELMPVRKPLSERLPEDVFSSLHEVVGKVAMSEPDLKYAGRVAFELCHYVADLLDKAREEACNDRVCYKTGGGKALLKRRLVLEKIEMMKAINR